ncbi:MAG: VWA domain-containing protein [Methylobacteriaceae bacterium]|nr:VWA domain-containing protein [Methylobacteriaceae bacterium]
MPSTLSTIAKPTAALPVLATGGPRFVVSLDATLSRANTWREARAIQGELFKLMASRRARLAVRLTHFGGGKFKALDWCDDVRELQAYMAAVSCSIGGTQIADVLDDTFSQGVRGPVSALIYTGDACEEKQARLCGLAMQLRCIGVPAFMFQEGRSRKTARVFEQIASITGGAYARFETGAFRDLAGLFKVAVTARSKNPAMLARIREDPSLTAPARLMLADLSGRVA